MRIYWNLTLAVLFLACSSAAYGGVLDSIPGPDTVLTAPKKTEQATPPATVAPAQPAQSSTAPPAADVPTGKSDAALAPGKTAAAPVSPVGESYFAEISANGVTKWPVSRMPIKVLVKSGSGVRGFHPSFESTLKQSFADWSDASNGQIKFAFVAAEPQADIVCSWTDDPSRMSAKNEDGQAVLIPDAQGILRADILLLTQSPPGKDISDKYARRVSLHEVGHALGISGHSDQPTDIMYRTVDPGDRDAAISNRDRNTLVALYQTDAKTQPQLTSTASTGLPVGANPQAQAMKLSNEAVAALSKKQPEEAMKKLEQAHKLDPKNALINANLGGMYANYAAMATMLRNFPLADSFFVKAIPLLEQSPNKKALASVLESYASVLRATNRAPEAEKIEARLKALQSGK